VGGIYFFNQNIFKEALQKNDSTQKTPSGKVANLSGQNLSKAPSYIFDQKEIVEHNLSNNYLSGALQSQVGNLKALKVLNLSNNKFTGIPAEIGQLKDLEILDLSNNLITGLPSELGNLSNLKLLDLSGNDYSETDLADIKSRLPASTVIKTD
jgi:Leucine-rich repeat (LRR) protein